MKITPLLILLTLAISCFAQNESLLIGPGDQLHVQVFDTDEMEQHPRVTDAGTIPLLFIGEVKVSGMTPQQAGQAIEDVLKQKQMMLHPQVAVTVEAYANQQIAVMGQVQNPGRFSVTTKTSLIGVLSLAGGLTDLADRHITIQRHNDPNEKVTYFLSNDSKAAFDGDVSVNPGDTVIVPKVGIVYVLGDVGRPGGYPMTTNDSKISVLQALAMAGTADKTAALKKAKLFRRTESGTQEVPISLAEMQRGDKPDVIMQSDDMLFIPFSWMRNLALSGSQITASATSALIYAHP